MSFSQINTNIQSMQAFSSLQNTASELATRRQRLSTGLRINKAEDDSAGFAIAKKLQAKTRGQSQALKNINDAKSMLTVAEGGLNSSLDILQTMKEKAVQAANDSLGDNERNAIQSQLEELTKEIGDIVGNSSFNGTKLLDGTGGDNGDGKLNFQVGAENGDSFAVQLDSSKTGDIGVATSDGSLNQVTFQEDFDLSTEPSMSVGADYDEDGGEFELEITNFTDTDGTADSGDETFDVSVNGGTAQTVDMAATTTIDLADPDGDATTVGDNGTDEITLDFASVTASEIDSGIDNGGKMTVRATESTLDVSDHSSASSAVDTIDSAIDEVTDRLAHIGDAQKRLSFKGENLETSRTNLETARSGIEDADFAREQMQIAKLQILQQTGTATLAQANASSQGVLSLIGGG